MGGAPDQALRAPSGTNRVRVTLGSQLATTVGAVIRRPLVSSTPATRSSRTRTSATAAEVSTRPPDSTSRRCSARGSSRVPPTTRPVPLVWVNPQNSRDRALPRLAIGMPMAQITASGSRTIG